MLRKAARLDGALSKTADNVTLASNALSCNLTLVQSEELIEEIACDSNRPAEPIP